MTTTTDPSANKGCWRLVFPSALLAFALASPVARTAVTIDGYTSTGTTLTTHDLTALGALDWAHWGGWEGGKSSPGFDRKNGANLISNYSALNGGATNFTNGFYTLGDPQYATYGWTNGTTQTTQTNAPYGLVILAQKASVSGAGSFTSGLIFTVKAGLDARKLIIFTGGYNAQIKLTATLSSGETVSDTWAGTNTWRNGYYTLTFTGRSADDVLAVTIENLTTATTNGNFTFQAAALRPTPGTPYPAEISAWTEAQKEDQRNAGRQLLALLEQAGGDGRSLVVVPQGHYRFAQPHAQSPAHYQAHVALANLQDMVIDFQGSTLWFETAATGIVLRKSRRVTLKNVILDWDPLPFTQGRITAIDTTANAIVVRLDPAYERILPDMQDNAYWRGTAFDPVTNRFKESQIGWGFNFTWNNRKPDGTRRFSFGGFHDVKVADSGLAAGDLVALWARRGHGIGQEGNEDCSFEDITLYSCPFIGYSENTGAGNTRYLRCKILRRPGTDRLLGGNADGFNVACVERGPTIDSCEIDTIGDDFVNVHHFFSRVLWQEESGKIIISPIAYQGAISGEITVEFFDRQTMERLGERKATVEVLPSWLVSEDRCLADLSVRWLAGEASGLAYGKSVRVHRLTLDSPLNISGDVIVNCPKFGSPGAVIENNHFRGSLARGLRLQSPQLTVRNNTLEDICHEAITLSGQPGHWGEGPYVTDAIVSNNLIKNVCMTTRPSLKANEPGDFPTAILVEVEDAADPSRIQKNILIDSNIITDTAGGVGIHARNTHALQITGNHISRHLLRPAAGPRGVSFDDPRLHHAIVLAGICDSDSLVSDNVIESPGPEVWGEIHSDNSDASCPDDDGLPLLLKYATGLPAGTMSAAGPTELSSHADRLVLNFTRLHPAPLSYTVEASDDLVIWTAIVSLPSGADSWEGDAVVSESGSGGFRSVLVADTEDISSRSRRFLRLRVGDMIRGTVPQGFVTLTLPGAATSTVSFPLEADPVARGRVQAVTTDTVTIDAAGNWAGGAAPHALRLMTGNATGATFPIAAVSGDIVSLTVPAGLDLTQIVAGGDICTVFPLRTLGALFDAASMPFLTGATAASADTLQRWSGSAWLTFYHNGLSWRQVGVPGSRNNILLDTDSGWILTRRASDPLSVTVFGRVHEVPPRQFTHPSGSVFLAAPHPTTVALRQLGFASASEWLAASSAASADLLQIWNGAAWLTFYHNGSAWRQVGTPVAQDDHLLSPGQALFVIRKSTPSASQAFVSQLLPYTP